MVGGRAGESGRDGKSVMETLLKKAVDKAELLAVWLLLLDPLRVLYNLRLSINEFVKWLTALAHRDGRFGMSCALAPCRRLRTISQMGWSRLSSQQIHCSNFSWSSENLAL